MSTSWRRSLYLSSSQGEALIFPMFQFRSRKCCGTIWDSNLRKEPFLITKVKARVRKSPLTQTTVIVSLVRVLFFTNTPVWLTPRIGVRRLVTSNVAIVTKPFVHVTENVNAAELKWLTCWQRDLLHALRKMAIVSFAMRKFGQPLHLTSFHSLAARVDYPSRLQHLHISSWSTSHN